MKHLKTFTDSSGRECVQVLAPEGWPVAYPIGSDTDEEVAAYYRKREDERLGRESFEVDGELFYVFVVENRPVEIMVSNAVNSNRIFSPGDEPIDHPSTPIFKAYNMWFEAHKPPKEPQEGEIWEIETGSSAQWRCVVRDGWFVSVNVIHAPSYAVDDEHIVRKEFIL